MERGNEVVQPAAAPATTANVGTVSNSVGNMSADVGGVDMGGLNISVAGGAAGAGSKQKENDKDDGAARQGSRRWRRGQRVDRRMSIVGLEHEYIVRRGETAVDFRALLHDLAVPGRRLDPGDPHAYRLRSGAALTCDGAEAEIATPPVDLTAGFVGVVDEWARASTAQLQGVLGDEYSLEGVSTHMSVEVPDESTTAVAALFARHFAPALMLLSDGVDSPGLLVRPRFGRVELGTDYTSGPHRRASTALAVGGVLASLDAARRRRAIAALPRPMRTAFVPATSRWGWYVDRRAFGVDLYEHGRAARLRRVRSLGHDRGQDVLERSWSCARAALAGFASAADLHDADVVVGASVPLPCEHDRCRDPDPSPRSPNASSFGDIVELIQRPGFSVEAVTATWDFTLFAAQASRTVYLTVPRLGLPAFLADLRAGRLDEWIRSLIRAPHQDRVLRNHTQALERAVFDDVDSNATLTAPERDRQGRPVAARVASAVIEGTASRVGKGLAYVSPQSFVPGDGRRKRLWLLVAVLAVLLVGGVAAGLAASDGDDTAVATATTEVPTSIVNAATVQSISPSATGAPTTLAPLPSVVIRTTFLRPVTTYTVVIDGADASSFTYAWRIIGNETPECAARMLVDGPNDRSVTWDHPHPPCAIGSDHADTVIEVVATSSTLKLTCRFQGAAESEQPCVVARQ